MNQSRSVLSAICCLTLLAAAGPDAAALGRMVTHPIAWSRSSPVDLALVELAALVGWLCVAWTVGGAALLLLARAPGGTGRIAATMAHRLLPAVLRRGLEAALGLALAVSTGSAAALPAAAQATPTSPPATAGPFDRPATAPPVLGRTIPAAVVVTPGDTLWHIAADALRAGATDAEIDRAWRRWYAANSAVVGTDPDLIHPGQRLAPPSTP